MPYQPPNDILEILQKLEFQEALPADDPRYVETMARKFGLMLSDGRLSLRQPTQN